MSGQKTKLIENFSWNKLPKNAFLDSVLNEIKRKKTW